MLLLDKKIKIPKALHDLHGEENTVGNLLLVYIAAFIGALVLPLLHIMQIFSTNHLLCGNLESCSFCRSISLDVLSRIFQSQPMNITAERRTCNTFLFLCTFFILWSSGSFLVDLLLYEAS